MHANGQPHPQFRFALTPFGKLLPLRLAATAASFSRTWMNRTWTSKTQKRTKWSERPSLGFLPRLYVASWNSNGSLAPRCCCATHRPLLKPS